MKRLVVFALLALAACGKRGDPHPPVPIIPKATSDLVVTQRGSKVILSWSYPSLTTAGKKLGSVRRVIVYRYVETLPVPATGRDPNTILPGDVDTTIPRPLALFAKLPTVSAQQFLKLRERVDSIEGANLPAATTGARLSFEDSPEFHTKDNRPVRLNYAVVTEGGTTAGALSNIAVIVPLDVPLPPSALTATAKAEGIVLTWTAPEKAPTASPLIGYDVYRTDAGAEVDELAPPVNSTPVKATTYTDVPPYGAHDYRVTAVVSQGPPRIESDPTPAATATFKDLLPPPAPANLAALVETKAVRLVWDAVEAADLAGYNVYRTEGTGAPLRPNGKLKLTPKAITATNFRDIAIDPGISYFYEVTSVDKSGNESAVTKTEWVLVPKTP